MIVKRTETPCSGLQCVRRVIHYERPKTPYRAAQQPYSAFEKRRNEMIKTITPKVTNKSEPRYLWAKVQSYCKMYNIPLAELASVMNVSKNTVANYNHKPENVTLKCLYKFLSAYHLTISELESF